MNKLLKLLALIGAGLLSLVLIALVAAWFFLNPNHYRETLELKASEQIGHPVTLEGNLSANYFPWLGLTAKQVRIGSSTVNDAPLASIETLSFKVQTVPLLKKQIKLDTIIIDKANINLLRQADGQANWEAAKKTRTQELSKEPSPNAASDSSPLDNDNTAQSKGNNALTLEIAGIEIKHSEVIYTDKRSNQSFDLKDLRLIVSAIKTRESTPIEGQFTLAATQQDKSVNNTSDFQGTLHLKTYDPILFEVKDIKVNSVIESKQLPRSPLTLALQGDVEGDLQQAQLTFKDLDLVVDQSKAQGSVEFSWAKQKMLNFDLNVDSIDADRYLNLAQSETKTSNIALADVETPQGDAPSIEYVAFQPDEALHYKGNINVKRLSAKGLTLNDVQVTAQDTKQGLSLNPLKANLYQGKFQGKTDINLSNSDTHVKGQLNGVSLEALLKALKQEPKITGSANAVVDLIINNKGLNGTTQLNLGKGEIRGVDLDYYLKYARAVMKQIEKPTNDRKVTDFDSITATIKAHHNILYNDDLKLNADDFYAEGDGSIDLNKKYIEYDFIAHRIYKDGQEHPDALPLIVKVRGPFDQVKITPDVDAYIKTLIERETQDAIEKEINKQVDKLLGTDSEEGSSKIEKSLEKGIKKLFKF